MRLANGFVSKPLVLVPSCHRTLGDHPFHTAGKKYIDAVRLAGALPLIVPAATDDELDDLLHAADGLFLTGSRSNVHARHYGEDIRNPTLPLDATRDAWTLPLIRRAVELGLPVFAICRGFQELNVALGGSLHQAVQEQPGLKDHREAAGSLERQYGPAHPVQPVAGGLFASLVGDAPVQVNSLHGQGVNEATAPDGLIEAVSADSAGFAFGVQWHPEWQAASNPVSMILLRAFGDACRLFQQRRVAPVEPET
jgi:putative glutamine amidotransferase